MAVLGTNFFNQVACFVCIDIPFIDQKNVFWKLNLQQQWVKYKVNDFQITQSLFYYWKNICKSLFLILSKHSQKTFPFYLF